MIKALEGIVPGSCVDPGSSIVFSYGVIHQHHHTEWLLSGKNENFVARWRGPLYQKLKRRLGSFAKSC